MCVCVDERVNGWKAMSVEVPASSFYRHKEGRSTCMGRSEVVVFSPNRECAVDDHCWKYTVEYWRAWRRAWQLSWAAPWSRGDRAGVLLTPVSVVVVAVEGTVLHA